MEKKLFWRDWDYSRKFLLIFLIFQAIMWVVIPASYHDSLHYDPAETLMWGSTFNLGGAKHPPMAGYMLYHFCKLFGFPNFAIFLASQICLFAGFVFIYKLARCFFENKTAVMATLLISFYYFYNSETPKFNANTPHLLFVPMMLYGFYRGVTVNKLQHWLLLAVSGACAFMTKYYAGVFFVSFLAYIICDKNARKCLTTYKPYLAGILFFALLAPHLRHLWQTDFLVLKYVSSGEKADYGYVMQLVMILLAMIVPLAAMSLPAYLTQMISTKKLQLPAIRCVNPQAAKFALFILGGQAAVLLLMGICGNRLETMWTYQMFFPAGILIMAFYRDEVTERTIRIFSVLTVLFALTVMLSMLIYSNTRSSYRRHISKEELLTHARNYYRDQTGKEIPFIIGEEWHAALVQNAMKYSLRCCPDNDPILIGIHRENIRKHGALIVSGHPERSGKNILQHFDQQPVWQTVEIPYQARFGKKKKFKFHFAVLHPEKSTP
ncbi:MAG: glycosyltransferase family 39 protein [Lentisphaerae bacterium]|nr:glycosyltransferase family 39 protein [Lentisphaerota bacterium]